MISLSRLADLRPTFIDEVVKRVEACEDEVVKLCSRLVQFPTFNPPGITTDCVKFIEEYFERWGIRSKIYQNKEGKLNICGEVPGEKPGKILYLMHLDVVPEGDRRLWTYDPYGGVIADGKVYGRGACDMKGSCAAAMVAAKILSQLDPEKHCSAEFWFTCDEEVGSDEHGAGWLARTGRFKADVCLEGDCFMFPGRPAIDIGMKGGMGTVRKTFGKAAHGSQPHMGDNAIDKLIRVLAYAKRLEEYPLEIVDEMKPVYEACIKYYDEQETLTEEQKAGFKRIWRHPTVSLNLIKGGVKTNVVPDSAEAYLDIRICPGSNLQPIKEQLLKLIAESQVKDVEVKISGPTGGYYEPPNSKPVKQLIKTVELATGITPTLKVETGGNDAIYIKKYGLNIPCLGFGAGDEGLLHLTNEYVSIENLVICAKVYTVFPLVYAK